MWHVLLCLFSRSFFSNINCLHLFVFVSAGGVRDSNILRVFTFFAKDKMLQRMHYSFSLVFLHLYPKWVTDSTVYIVSSRTETE